MKIIKLPVLYKATLPPTESDFDEAREVRQLSGRIISGALAIEEIMINIISNTLLSDLQEHRDLAIGSILRSDWCSYSSKKKLILIIIDKFGFLKGKEKENLDRLLGKVMKYRNAHAHGNLVCNIDTHELHFYEGGEKVKKLDDKYFSDLEGVFCDAWKILNDISDSIKSSNGV